MPRQLTSSTRLDNLKKEAKRWLRALRAGDERAGARLRTANPGAPATVGLRDVHLALAREHGFANWATLRRQLAGSAETTLIQPDELASERPYGAWSSRGADVWEAIRAARAGDAASLRRLLARDPNLARYEVTLRFAVREGHIDAVGTLLDAGADADAIGLEGESLLTVARDRGHETVARLLEQARARQTRTVSAEAGSFHPAIHEAAEANDVTALRALLDGDPTLVHLGDRKGGTPLHRAVLGAARAAIELLLDRGADIHALHGAGPGDPAGYAAADFQPIDLALFWRRRGDTETARVLLGRGATLDLAVAAALGEVRLVTAMLDEDPAHIRQARPWGKRPLSAAVDFGHEQIARLLLDRGADPNWPEGPAAPSGFALHAAASAGNLNLVQLLLDHGADPNAHVDSAGNATYSAKTREVRALLMARGGTLDCYDLVWADEDDEVVRRVAADPRAADAGCGGVFTAAATLGKRDLVVRLLDAGARVPAMVTGCRSYLLEDPEILRLLLASGMSPDLPDWQRATLLHLLCGRDGRGRPRPHRTECGAILLDAGATLSARDEEYRSTPLGWAARNDLPDMVQFLLARGAPTNLADDQPWATPLAWALGRGHTPIAQLLRAAGAKV